MGTSGQRYWIYRRTDTQTNRETVRHTDRYQCTQTHAITVMKIRVRYDRAAFNASILIPNDR